MNFKEMVLRQQKIKTLIDNTSKKGRLNHAYLLYGDDGVGKKEMAYYFACKLYCPNGGCLECQVCQNILDNGHLNVEYIGVLDNKKLVSKEQIIDLQSEFAKTSLVEGARVYIVDGIDTASVAAQNSLLKFIEDPQNNEETYGLFIARDISKVVSTIQSRCNLIYFPTISKDALLETIPEIPLETRVMIAYLTNSSEEIKELYASEDMLKTIELVFKFMEIKNSSVAVLFYLNNATFLQDEKLSYFLRFLIIIHEDILHILHKEDLLFYPLHDKIEVYASKSNTKDAQTKLQQLLKLEARCGYNVIAKNVLHELIMKFYC